MAKKPKDKVYRSYMDASIADYQGSVPEDTAVPATTQSVNTPAVAPAAPATPVVKVANPSASVFKPGMSGTASVSTTEKPYDSLGDAALATLDNMTPDDSGGLLTGRTGWLNAVPGYQQTAGALVAGGLSAGGAAVDAMTFASDMANWGLSGAFLAANPHYWANRDNGTHVGNLWQDATQVSAGRAFQGAASPIQDALGQVVTGEQQGVYSIRPDFNIADYSEREAWFGLIPQSIGSGIADATAAIGADPTMLLGAGTTVIRYGTKFGKFGGIANQSLRNAAQVEKVGHDIDAGLANFIDPAEGQATGAFEHVKSLVDNDPAHLTDHVFVVNSNDPQLVMRAAQQVDPGDYATGAALAKALMGERSGWESLLTMKPSLFDTLYTGVTGVDILAPKAASGILDATQTAVGRGLVRDAQDILNRSINVGMDAEGYGPIVTRGVEGASEALPPVIPAGQVITRAGAESATAAKVGDAWRLGRAEGKWGSARVSTTKSFSDGGEGWAFNVVRSASGSRPVMIARWAGTGRPTNVVHLKGGDGTTANVEVHAWLTHSRIPMEQRTTLFNQFVEATGPEARRNALVAMEKAEVAEQAKRLGMTTDSVMTAYNSYNQMRRRKLWDLDRTKGDAGDTAFTIDENNNPIHVAGLYTELDESFPMLDAKEFQRVVSSNSKLLQSLGRTTDISIDTLDVVNNMWKVSVLLRLGYTMRNITEGALRSVATVGVLAMHPTAVMRVPSAMRYAAYKRVYTNSAKAQGMALNEARQNIAEAQKAVQSWRKAQGVEEMFALESEATNTRALLRAAERRLANGKNPVKDQAEVDRLTALLDTKQADIATARARINGALPDQNKNMTALVAAEDEAARIAAEIETTLAKMRSKAPKRKKVGEGGTVVGQTRGGKDIVYSAAFDGSEGDLARLLASADRTYSTIFETGFESRRTALKESRNWQKLDPESITTPAEWERYWDNLTLRYNQRYAHDPIIKNWLRYGDTEGTMVKDTRALLMSDRGSALRGTLRTPSGARLVDGKGHPIPERVDEYLAEVYRRYTDEIPAGSGLRERLLEGDMAPYEVQAKWVNRRPPVIPAPVEDGAGEVKSLFGHAYDGYQSVTGMMMKFLGSIPETKLLRHPYYSAIYRGEQLRMAQIAVKNGASLESRTVRVGIEKAAHREALKQTRRTMYTIERQSNASNALRFVMPFFPAWENSIRTWGRIIYQNPAVLGAAALAWDIPNSLGWVVDENGNKVEHSNFLSTTEKRYIVYPEPLLRAAAKIAGPELPGIGRVGEAVPILNTMLPPLDDEGNPMPIQTNQSSLNVVFPGGLLDPGIGPMQVAPVALALRGKPEFVEVLRANMPEKLFNSLTANGNPNTPIPDLFLPTTIKKIKYKVLAGEDENTAYLRLQNTMVQDEIIRLKAAGQPLTERAMAKVLDRASKMWDWTIGQAVTGFTASTGYRSPFTVERAIWQSLLDDTTLTYSQKTAQFLAKVDALHPGHGNDFLTLTKSTSRNDFGINNTQGAYDRLMNNKSTVEFISREYGDESVGMFTNIGDTSNPFSYAVYGELTANTIDGKPIREKMTPQEIRYADEVSSGWQQYFLIVDELDAQAVAAGLTGYKEIKDVNKILDKARQYVGSQFPGYANELSKGWDTTRVNKTIATARMIVAEASDEDMKNNPTIRVLAEYLAVRDATAKAVAQVDSDDGKNKVKSYAMSEVMRLRGTDLGFADFYDRYLSDDDFRSVAG